MVRLMFHSLVTFSRFANQTSCTQEYKATKKQTVRLQLNEKKSKESQTRLKSWYWKRKPTWRKDLITYNNHPWVMFSFNWLVIIWRRGEGVGIRLRLDVQGQGGGRILDVDGQGGGGSWKLDNFHGRHMCIIPNYKCHGIDQSCLKMPSQSSAKNIKKNCPRKTRSFLLMVQFVASLNVHIVRTFASLWSWRYNTKQE